MRRSHEGVSYAQNNQRDRVELTPDIVGPGGWNGIGMGDECTVHVLLDMYMYNILNKLLF